MKVEEESTGLKKDVSWYDLTSPEVLPLETVESITASSCTRQKQVKVISPAMPSLLRPPRQCTRTGFKVAWKEEKAWSGFPKAMP